MDKSIDNKRVVAKINLDNINHNYDEIRKNITNNIMMMGVVKADAYGHGAVRISHELEKRGIDYLGVALLDEAINLRKNNISKPILILGYSHISEYRDIIAYKITQTIYSLDMANELNRVAKSMNKKVKVHLKIDTGMGRIGFRLDNEKDLIETIKKIKNLSNLEVEGIFTHFATSDDLDKSYTYWQIDKFNGLIKKLRDENITIPIIHAANSAATIDIKESHYNMVRLGLALYGYYPSEYVDKSRVSLKPALSLVSRVIFTKWLEKGEKVGYGSTYITSKRTRVATIPIGYADGYMRALSNKGQVIIKGKKANVIGNVCMDQIMVDVSHIDFEADKDLVTLIGKNEGEEISVEEIADICNTINYEILCLIGKRVPREYNKDYTIVYRMDYYKDIGD